jgi:hypothetical protein
VNLNPHVLFTAAYIFLFAESSPSYGRQPVLGPSLFSMSSGRRKLPREFRPFFLRIKIPSWMHSELHSPVVNHPGAVIYRGQFCHKKCRTGSIIVTSQTNNAINI